MDIPQFFLDSVGFLEIKNNGGFDQVGTCFFMVELNKKNGRNFLVTCRHVVRDASVAGQTMYVRLNLKEGSGVEHIPLGDQWLYHEVGGQDLVDLAVQIIKPDIKVRQTVVATLGTNLIYGREGMRRKFSRDMQLGDDVLFIGLFTEFPGHYRNHPLLRTGKIAMLVNEEMPGVASWLGTSTYFLVECQAYPGMSGSPVFVEKDNNFFLVGVMAGYFKEDEMREGRFTHMGISQVVPVEMLGDIIFHV